MGAALEFQLLSQFGAKTQQLEFKELTAGPGERWQSAVSHVSGVEREVAMNP